MELRARDERAVLVGDDREVDPDTLPLGADLTADLRDWARVAGAVGRAEGDAAAAVVARRGRQLAARVAEALNTEVSYADPVSGDVAVLAPPAPVAKPEPPPEPTPWGTGLLVAAFAFTLVVFAVGTLTSTLNETSPLLAVGANVVVTGGLLPSVWLTRGVPVWRWVALGVAVGIFAGWVALPFIIFG
ncbi:DUF2537 domain-containing protein [Actinokineospora sp. NPDC004072]